VREYKLHAIALNNGDIIQISNEMKIEEKYTIDRHTRFLIIKREDGHEEVVTDLRGNKHLQKIYKQLATEMWGTGSVGHSDLLEGLI
jgi:hypothetical protein